MLKQFQLGVFMPMVNIISHISMCNKEKKIYMTKIIQQSHPLIK